MRLKLAALAIVLTPSIPRPVGACDLLPPNGGPHELDPAQLGDDVAPSPVTVTASLEPGREESGCGGQTSSCGDLPASVQLSLTATDDRTPEEMLGFRIRIVRGQQPAGILIPATAVRATSGLIYMTHRDDDTIDFDLEIRAVDLNGNLGTATIVTLRG